MRILITILITASIGIVNLHGQEEDSLWEEPITEKILDKFYNLPPGLINNITIDAVYGYTGISFPNSPFAEDITPAYHLELRYGFTRFYDVRKIENRFYYAGEHAALANISSHLKPWRAVPPGLTTDTWRFGIGYKNGYGYDFSEDNYLIFYHSGSLLWSETDFEQNMISAPKADKTTQFDETLRFGQSFEGGAIYRIGSVFHLNAGFQQALVYPRHNFFGWMGVSMLELVMQRTVDFFGDDMLEINPDNWPFINLIVKYGISLLFYELRKSDIVWPSGNNKPLNFNSIKFGVVMLF